MIKIGIVGGTGYTGVELLRLLAQHPAGATCARSRRARKPARGSSDMFPSLRGRYDELAFIEPDRRGSQGVRRRLLRHAARRRDGAGARARRAPACKIIDLAADFRLRDAAVFEQMVQDCRTPAPTCSRSRCTGLPEINREAIRKARIVGNPGCYPTAVQLGFLPLLEAGVVDTEHLIADCKSGVSGAGRKAELGLLLRRGVRQLQGLRRQRATGTIPEIVQGLQPREHDAGEARVHAAPDADDPRHPRDAVRAAHRSPTSTCRRCTRSATRASRSST